MGGDGEGDDGPPAWRTPPPVLPFAARALTLDEYRDQLAHHLRRLAVHHLVHGKRRRSFTKKARQLIECGQRVRFRRCTGCGTADGKSARVLTRCDLRSCPACARAGGPKTSGESSPTSGTAVSGLARWRCT